MKFNKNLIKCRLCRKQAPARTPEVKSYYTMIVYYELPGKNFIFREIIISKEDTFGNFLDNDLDRMIGEIEIEYAEYEKAIFPFTENINNKDDGIVGDPIEPTKVGRYFDYNDKGEKYL